MAGETRGERNARLQQELGSILERLEQIRTELGEQAAGEESPEDRRRRFLLLPGGLAALVGLLGARPARAARNSKTIAASTVSAVGGAIGGAAITAAVMTHSGAPPHAGPAPTLLPPEPIPTAGITPTASPTQDRARPRHTALLPPIVVPSRRRGGVPSLPSAAPPGPGPSPSAIPAPTTPPGTPSPSSPGPSPSCVILLEVGRIITVCV